VNEDQEKQWIADVEELGDRAFTRWEYRYLKDQKNGNCWMRMRNNLQVDRSREFRRVSNVTIKAGGALPDQET